MKRRLSTLPPLMVMLLFFSAFLLLSCSEDMSWDDAGNPPADDICDPLFPGLLVTAHRGANLFAPENTLAAIEKAFELGADAVEIDVRNTADGYYVLMHDDTVDRTTDGSGLVAEMTLDEIKDLLVDDRRWGGIHGDLRVPTLEEAMATIAAHGGQTDIDMKTDEPEGAVRVLVEMGLEKLAFVYSSDMAKLDRVRSVSMDVRIQPSTSSEKQTRAILDHFDPDPEHIELATGGLTPGNVELIRSAGAVVFMDALGPRDYISILGLEDAWLRMMEGGVQIMQTDFPGELVRYRESMCR